MFEIEIAMHTKKKLYKRVVLPCLGEVEVASKKRCKQTKNSHNNTKAWTVYSKFSFIYWTKRTQALTQIMATAITAITTTTSVISRTNWTIWSPLHISNYFTNFSVSAHRTRRSRKTFSSG